MLFGLIPDKNQSVEDLREQISGLRQELAGTNEKLKQLDNDPEVILYKWRLPVRILSQEAKMVLYSSYSISCDYFSTCLPTRIDFDISFVFFIDANLCSDYHPTRTSRT